METEILITCICKILVDGPEITMNLTDPLTQKEVKEEVPIFKDNLVVWDNLSFSTRRLLLSDKLKEKLMFI